MIYIAAVVSLFLLAAGIAVIVGMITPNLARISDALLDGGTQVLAAPRAKAPTPRLIAVRPMLRAAA